MPQFVFIAPPPKNFLPRLKKKKKKKKKQLVQQKATHDYNMAWKADHAGWGKCWSRKGKERITRFRRRFRRLVRWAAAL